MRILLALIRIKVQKRRTVYPVVSKPMERTGPMSHTPHELTEEFPHHIDRIHALRTSDAHFAELAARYHHVNRAIHRAETNVEPTDDVHLEDLRKERVALKDQVWALLKVPAA